VTVNLVAENVESFITTEHHVEIFACAIRIILWKPQ